MNHAMLEFCSVVFRRRPVLHYPVTRTVGRVAPWPLVDRLRPRIVDVTDRFLIHVCRHRRLVSAHHHFVPLSAWHADIQQLPHYRCQDRQNECQQSEPAEHESQPTLEASNLDFQLRDFPAHHFFVSILLRAGPHIRMVMVCRPTLRPIGHGANAPV